MNRTHLDKPAWRKNQRLRLRQQCPENQAALTSALAAHLTDWLHARQHAPVLCYSPLPDEPNLRPLFAALQQSGIPLALPRVAEDQTTLEIFVWQVGARFVSGAFGIDEPDPATWQALPASALGAALIPGLAFDPATGIRLGRGAGYYDRLLARPDFRAETVGIALPWHLATALPADPHDHPMHFLATPGGIHRISPAPAGETPESA